VAIAIVPKEVKNARRETADFNRAILAALLALAAGALFVGYFELHEASQQGVIHKRVKQQSVERHELPVDVVAEDKVVLKTGEEFAGEVIKQTNVSIEIRPTSIGTVDVTYKFPYDEIADIVFGRKKVEGLLTNSLMHGYFEVKKYQDHIYALYTNGAFAKLDAEAVSLRESRLRFANGEW
jgi:hypothetical protein